MNYVVGFLFSPDKKKVVLIRKNRPDWQKGYYNGVGGHIDGMETAWEAMIREFNEETGVLIDSWDCFAEGDRVGTDVRVYFYRAFSDMYNHVFTCTDEKIVIKDVYKVRYLKRVYNLDWLIYLALDENTIISRSKFVLPNTK